MRKFKRVRFPLPPTYRRADKGGASMEEKALTVILIELIMIILKI